MPVSFSSTLSPRDVATNIWKLLDGGIVEEGFEPPSIESDSVFDSQ